MKEEDSGTGARAVVRVGVGTGVGVGAGAGIGVLVVARGLARGGVLAVSPLVAAPDCGGMSHLLFLCLLFLLSPPSSSVSSHPLFSPLTGAPGIVRLLHRMLPFIPVPVVAADAVVAVVSAAVVFVAIS